MVTCFDLVRLSSCIIVGVVVWMGAGAWLIDCLSLGVGFNSVFISDFCLSF